MQQIDFSLGYDCNGFFRPSYFFMKRKGTMPNKYTYVYGDDAPNLVDLDTTCLKDAFPDGFVHIETQKIGFDVSAAVEEDDDEDVNIWATIDLYLFTDDFIAEIDCRNIVIFTDKDRAFAEETISQIIAALPKQENTPPSAKIELVCRDSEYYTTQADIKKVTLDIDKQFNDDFKPYYDKLLTFLDSGNKESGVVVLNGEAGTGKSSLIRHLVNNVPNHYIYINPTMASNLTDSALTTFLIAHKNSVFILEDCEQVIMDREEGSLGSAVASLLNMSDGLMSDVFNGKFICTFNTDLSNVDQALLRKGRCKVKYTFNKLCAEKTKALLIEQGVSPEEAEGAGPLTIADIYNYGEDTGVKDTSLTIGF